MKKSLFAVAVSFALAAPAYAAGPQPGKFSMSVFGGTDTPVCGDVLDGAIAPVVLPPLTPHDRIFNEFDAYLRSERGLTPKSIVRHLPIIRRFLHEVCSGGAGDLSKISQEDVIRYIEPLQDNQAARGLDVGSEALRREAIERAIDSGQPTMTAPIALVQDGRQSPGFLMYDPVYRPTSGRAPRDTAERRGHRS